MLLYAIGRGAGSGLHFSSFEPRGEICMAFVGQAHNSMINFGV